MNLCSSRLLINDFFWSLLHAAKMTNDAAGGEGIRDGDFGRSVGIGE